MSSHRLGHSKIPGVPVWNRIYPGDGPSSTSVPQASQVSDGRLMRWALALQPYRFLLRAIRGRDNVGADCLSRNPLETDES